MKHITRSFALAGMLGSLALVGCDGSNNQRSSADAATPGDRSTSQGAQAAPRTNETTAINQSNASEHIDITARIRRAVMEDDALSTTAKNATIVTDSMGTVTLRGDVRSQAEKDAITAKAAAVVGERRVIDRLVINP